MKLIQTGREEIIYYETEEGAEYRYASDWEVYDYQFEGWRLAYSWEIPELDNAEIE